MNYSVLAIAKTILKYCIIVLVELFIMVLHDILTFWTFSPGVLTQDYP